eukprot:TRINITY_DN212_c2_g1_i1.p1 TRINITY_DN212_c2_g1~~TRINITY_DN212_c2_g1_i1.p1  ORF type:complete len:737 (+),score=231.81 TRINITY_DN212_c2_g1_i1:23-2233(+)
MPTPSDALQTGSLKGFEAGSAGCEESISNTTLKRELDAANVEKIQLMSEVRLRAQDVRELNSETTRLRELISAMQEQHKAKLMEHVDSKEALRKKVSRAEDLQRQCTAEAEQHAEELKTSLEEREALSNIVEKLSKDKEEKVFKIHEAEDRADEWQIKYENLATERSHQQEELAALRASSDFNEEYIKSIVKSRDSLQEHAKQLQAQLQEVITMKESNITFSDIQHTSHHTEDPHPHPHPYYEEQYHQEEDHYHDEQGYPPDDRGYVYPPINDPLSPLRNMQPPEDVYYPEEEGRDSTPMQRPSHGYGEELGRVNAKLNKLTADIHSTRVEEKYVQQDYIIEASAKLNGALASLETFCSVITDWKCSINNGREPWGDLQSQEEAMAHRRLRDIEKRATLKKEVSRTMEASGMPTDAINILEVFFSAGRVRDAVTFAMEAFQASRESADSCMGAARRTIQESLEAAKAQSSGMCAALNDAGQLDSRLRELTQAKFEAEQQILSLQRQVDEREVYQAEVERLSKLMKDEAQNERQKMSEIALNMTEKQKEELQGLVSKHKKEMEEICERHVNKTNDLQAEHVKTVSEMSMTIQELKDTIAEMEKDAEERDKKLGISNAKKKSHRNAKEGMMAELNHLKHALTQADRDGKEAAMRLRACEKENMVLKDLAAKLESDVRRGRVMVEGEAHRHAFEAWQSSMVPQNRQPPRADVRSRTERRPFAPSPAPNHLKPSVLRPFA